MKLFCFYIFKLHRNSLLRNSLQIKGSVRKVKRKIVYSLLSILGDGKMKGRQDGVPIEDSSFPQNVPYTVEVSNIKDSFPWQKDGSVPD